MFWRLSILVVLEFSHSLALGLDVAVEVRNESLQKGDLFLLCSDGLTTMLSKREIGAILSSRKIDQSTCEALVNAANENGGQDNISCVLVQCR